MSLRKSDSRLWLRLSRVKLHLKQFSIFVWLRESLYILLVKDTILSQVTLTTTYSTCPDVAADWGARSFRNIRDMLSGSFDLYVSSPQICNHIIKYYVYESRIVLQMVVQFTSPANQRADYRFIHGIQ